MAIKRTAKVQAEIDRTKAKLAEQQNKLKELEAKRTELENMEIVEIVRGLSVPIEDLSAILQSIKTGSGITPASTSSQDDPKPLGSKTMKDIAKEDETE